MNEWNLQWMVRCFMLSSNSIIVIIISFCINCVFEIQIENSKITSNEIIKKQNIYSWIPGCNISNGYWTIYLPWSPPLFAFHLLACGILIWFDFIWFDFFFLNKMKKMKMKIRWKELLSTFFELFFFGLYQLWSHE